MPGIFMKAMKHINRSLRTYALPVICFQARFSHNKYHSTLSRNFCWFIRCLSSHYLCSVFSVLQIIFCIASKIKSTRIKNLATDSLSKPVRNLCLISSSKFYIYLNFLQSLLQGQSSCPYISFVKKSSCLKYFVKN